MELASCVVFIVIAFATRATLSRIVAALVGGAVAASVAIGADSIAYSLAWWHYPAVTTPFGPLFVYVAIFFGWGAGFALIGWRLTRRFGWRGQFATILFVSLCGPARDYAIATLSPGLIVFGAGIKPIIGDALCWATVIGVAQGSMRIIAGPARHDQLARTAAM